MKGGKELVTLDKLLNVQIAEVFLCFASVLGKGGHCGWTDLEKIKVLR